MDQASILKNTPQEVKDLLKDYSLPEITGDIRHWGGYIHLKKANEYDEKILWINPTGDPSHPIKALSLQYHGIDGIAPHREVFTAMTDMVLLIGSGDLSKLSGEQLVEALTEQVNSIQVVFLKRSSTYEIPGGFLHAYVNPFYDRPVILIEKRISPRDQSADIREANIYRLFDQDGRGTRGLYPEEIMRKIGKAKEAGR
ncbi:MAG: hypothetical protein UZ21_OP11001000212 [Microgenomates bacterium OLB22]|nr:MAG: hypothetical protein UZ21_OP11001000212 [Microgenomates bacterium OLB22]